MSNRKVTTFSHLHLHSSFGSLLDGVGKPLAYCEKAAELGMESLAVTEHGSCASHYSFTEAGRKTGTKIILGNEAYYTADRHQRGLTDAEKKVKPLRR